MSWETRHSTQLVVQTRAVESPVDAYGFAGWAAAHRLFTLIWPDIGARYRRAYTGDQPSQGSRVVSDRKKGITGR